ncbi:serine protease [Halobacteriovorax sp. JY17]|uniref:serine protease n=1 Tax=Halobacteriovorax sp. JY17 TaxID=2014617 RepID=UPI000C4DB88C|nr:serine protease [Halobacteriovorax sp. JY17]PIK14839.1 MAG: hypothetical protein CES88_10920 [Halobacteriovorax sp. JY17]
MMITSLQSLKKQSVLLILISIFFISCGKKDATSAGVAQLVDSQIIVGSLDWKEISDLSESNLIRKASSPIADVTLPAMQSRCTGFLISEDVLMTNEHCIPSASDAEGVTASFRHLKGVSEGAWEKYDCSTFLMNNSQHDFALLKCAGKPGRKFGFVKLDSSVKRSGASIYIVQQNCDYYSSRSCDWSKKYSKGTITDVLDEYTHSADTLGGSSGSPMFDASSHKVVGLHHAGYGNDGMGRGYENYAVKMSEIVPVIESRFPDLLVGGDSSDTPSSSQDDNGTLSKAFKLSGKNQSITGLEVSSGSDLDYYSIKADDGSEVTVRVIFDHSDGDLDIFQVSRSGSVIKKVESSTDNEEFSFVSNGEEVFFVVFGYKGAVNDYSMSVTSISNEEEENNTFDSAQVISFSGEKDFSLEKNDTDFFKFDLSKTTTVLIKASFSHGKGDLDMKVFDKDRKVIASSLSTKNIEEVSKTLSKGTYYIQVYGYKGVGNSYKLSVQK